MLRGNLLGWWWPQLLGWKGVFLGHGDRGNGSDGRKCGGSGRRICWRRRFWRRCLWNNRRKNYGFRRRGHYDFGRGYLRRWRLLHNNGGKLLWCWCNHFGDGLLDDHLRRQYGGICYDYGRW